MRKVAVLSALTLALCLSACAGVTTRTPDPVAVTPDPAPQTATVELATDAAVLERTGLSITLVGQVLTLKETTMPLSVRLKLPDGSYSPATGGEGGQSLANAQYIEPVAVGTVVEVGQGFFEPAATVVLKQ